jgi:alpha-D-xyloside xylohydrolase
VLRTLFFEFPDDPTAWQIEDQYMFGSDLLVAPLMEDLSTGRKVYLPAGTDWIDYQSGQTYTGGAWHDIEAGAIPIVLLVRDNAVIPHVAVAQSTQDIDWKNVELRVFSTSGGPASGRFALPDGEARTLTVENGVLTADPYAGSVNWRVTAAGR